MEEYQILFPETGMLTNSPSMESALSDTISQNMFQVDERANLANNTHLESIGSFNSCLDFLGDNGEAAIMDYLTENNYLETTQLFTEPLDVSSSLDLNFYLSDDVDISIEEKAFLNQETKVSRESESRHKKITNTEICGFPKSLLDNLSVSCNIETLSEVTSSRKSKSNTSSDETEERGTRNVVKARGDARIKEEIGKKYLKDHAKKCSTSSAESKYFEMRRKNNIASQRSRKTRKVKDVEMLEKVKKLEDENKALLLVAERLQKQKESLQTYLLKVISRK